MITYFQRMMSCEKAIRKLGIKRDLTKDERDEIARAFRELLSRYEDTIE